MTAAAQQSTASPRRRIVVGGERSQVGSVRDFAIDQSGMFYVLDDEDFTVKVVDARGNVQRRMGGKGHGPGELWTPAALRLADSTLTVTDASNGLISFSTAGRLLSNTRRPTLAGSRAVSMRGGVRLGIEPSDQNTKAVGLLFDTLLVLTATRAGSKPDTLALIRRDLAWYRVPGSPPITLISGFGNSATWTTIGDSLAIIADGITGDVRFLTFDERGWQISRRDVVGHTARRATANDRAEAQRRHAASTRAITISNGEVRGGPALPPGTLDGLPTYISVASHSFASFDGAVWVGSYIESNTTVGSRWTVFRKNQNPLRTTLPPSVRIRAVRGTTAYAITETEDGFRVIEAFTAR
ncbi:MAG: hypothetical protein IT353_06430 [Gemmatimonadaceae bacterium]|nr:hypothetical protein [Gemmatimonadaceae bacterium]